MSDPESLAEHPHPVALLLPWYLSAQLSESERREVDAHLSGCTACRDELAELGELRARAREMLEGAPAPGAHVRHRVLSQIGGPAGVTKGASRRGLIESVASATQWLLAPKWAPALALLLIVGQLGTLAWLGMRVETPAPLISRAVTRGAVRLRVVFNPTTTERDVLSGIRALDGRIVDGPAADGAYVIELAPATPQVIAAKIRALREQPGLVDRIELAPP